ncbi:hypothetical protein AAF712_013164 [Marasmius tenuissimus]|uniref:Uncharacterized protein n=1 Tax=Marasmius tenuissimus TaxID=585030 RepID=A0ABR2ZGG2_9AGAR
MSKNKNPPTIKIDPPAVSISAKSRGKDKREKDKSKEKTSERRRTVSEGSKTIDNETKKPKEELDGKGKRKQRSERAWMFRLKHRRRPKKLSQGSHKSSGSGGESPSANSKVQAQAQVQKQTNRSNKLPTEPQPHTDLEQEVQTPWVETFRLGYGVNALTGESTTRCALQRFASVPKRTRKISKTKTTIDVIHWNDLKNITDRYEFEAGVGTGTINVGVDPAIEFRAKLASVLSKSSSARTVLVMYRSVGAFEMEFLPENISIRKEVMGKEFREQYGDYYVAGCQAGYSCRAVIVCQINETALSESFEAAAKAHVEKLVTVGGSWGEGTAESKDFTLLHVVVDTRGCLPELSGSGSMSGSRSVAETLKALANSTKKPPGTPFTALLHHYSTLSPTIPRRIEGIHNTVFTRARKMRELYAHLQAFLIHPALRNFENDRTNINTALKAFESARRTMLDPQFTNTHKSMYEQLESLRDRSITLDSRYEFIRGVKNMDCTIRTSNLPSTSSLSSPSGSPEGRRSGTSTRSTKWQWECGKTGGKMTDTAGGLQVMSFGPGYKAYEVTWTSPLVSQSKSEAFLQNVGLGFKASATKYMEFKVLPKTDVPNPPRIPRVKAHGIFAVPYLPLDTEGGTSGDGRENNVERLAFTMVGAPVFIVGWTLSCEWPETSSGDYRNQPSIRIEDHRNTARNFILSDHLSIKLDVSKPAKWTCRVTFVFQMSYDFPDLGLKPGAGEGVLSQANSLLPSSGPST